MKIRADQQITIYEDLDVNTNKVINVVDPTDPQDAATKKYVDLAVAALKLDEYFSAVAASGIYSYMDTLPATPGTVVSAGISSNTTTNVFDFITYLGEPHLDRLLAGEYEIHSHLLKTGLKTFTVYAELYYRPEGMGEILVGTSTEVGPLTTSDAQYDTHITVSTEIPLGVTDRLVLKFYAISAGPAVSSTVIMTVGGIADPHLAIGVQAVELDQIFLPYTGAKHDTDLGIHLITSPAPTLAGHLANKDHVDAVKRYAFMLAR